MIAKQNIPQLRFQEFDGEWEKSKLNKFASLNPKNSELPESFIYIDLESVTDGLLIKESIISKNEAPSRAQRILKDKDILYQTVRPYQKNNLYFDKVGDYPQHYIEILYIEQIGSVHIYKMKISVHIARILKGLLT